MTLLILWTNPRGRTKAMWMVKKEGETNPS
uniref:Uncharacterized protein n=1 Tax=Rhizophora mucronata TaxID=61149 RepID=A0A2P2IUR7_RHIMU